MFLISGTPSKLTLHCLLDFCGMRPDCNCRYGDSAVFIIEDSNINGQLVSGVCSGMGMVRAVVQERSRYDDIKVNLATFLFIFWAGLIKIHFSTYQAAMDDAFGVLNHQIFVGLSYNSAAYCVHPCSKYVFEF